MIYAYNEIEHVHLEVSTLCNAKCPICPRNFKGYPHNGGYPELNLTLENVKKIFTDEFLQQLKGILINGNFGDAVMNPEVPEMVKYFKSANPNIDIEITTNGSARNKQWWEDLAKYGANVFFDLDGLDNNTHKLYRQNTLFETVIRNAKIFMNAGGKATWKLIPFEHNKHQIQQCEQLSKELGFEKFWITDDGRDTTEVYDSNGNLTHVIGNIKHPNNTVFDDLNNSIEWKEEYCDYSSMGKESANINCDVKRNNSVYVTATGEVFPCCWTAYYPKTYSLVGNQQINKIVNNNNALEVGIENAIQWFDSIEQSWNKNTYNDGRLFICDNQCGCN